MVNTNAANGWWRELVTAAPARTGKLAIVRADGSPHVTPVWLDLDGDTIVFTTNMGTVKGKAIARDGRVSICLDDERPPFAYVTVTGRAEIDRDLGQVRHWMGRIAARYLGEERGQAFADRYCGPGEAVVHIRDAKVTAHRNITA
ncbi:PPOX class F420-dependent oxidoreductase [Saccharothrix sp. S26]|uniref:PPOX class F420-dependent oxidoreductase n=1 Tax=Saccharothrix sp. S26 TaxID=2907215 RepID=UPI001F1CA523|nr:PPOX class F420-dependent oxidoreductase [Saccharothrix sp. S26]MCE7001045.1 PPOX class F420-dependent oxidoreductase [Saccharothrix sp. S26]